ncbi:hypothetical protein D3C85_1698790 [compost metagenome]
MPTQGNNTAQQNQPLQFRSCRRLTKKIMLMIRAIRAAIRIRPAASFHTALVTQPSNSAKATVAAIKPRLQARRRSRPIRP